MKVFKQPDRLLTYLVLLLFLLFVGISLVIQDRGEDPARWIDHSAAARQLIERHGQLEENDYCFMLKSVSLKETSDYSDREQKLVSEWKRNVLATRAVLPINELPAETRSYGNPRKSGWIIPVAPGLTYKLFNQRDEDSLEVCVHKAALQDLMVRALHDNNSPEFQVDIFVPELTAQRLRALSGLPIFQAVPVNWNHPSFKLIKAKPLVAQRISINVRLSPTP